MLKTEIAYKVGDCFVKQRGEGKLYYFVANIADEYKVKYLVCPVYEGKVVNKAAFELSDIKFAAIVKDATKADKAESVFIQSEAFAFFQDEYRKYAELADKTWELANKIEAIRY